MEAKDPKLAELEAQHNTKIYVIEGVDESGTALKMYLRKPDYKTKKAAFETLLADPKAVLVAGEIILLGCYVGGDNLYENEDTRLEAALAAAELTQMNSTIALKKLNEARFPETGDGDDIDLRHINALIRYHLHIDPLGLFTEGPDGELNDDKYVEVWAGLEWVLRREQQLRLR